jgi:RNA polymerase sigma factor (sigma-70 family)
VGAQDAEDLLQDAYVRLLQHPDPASIDDPRAFLYRVSANLATDRDRAQAVRARHHTTTEALERVASTGPGPDALTAQHERLKRIARAMAQLPEGCRTAFVLRRIEGYSYTEVAQRLGISESMVAKHLDRATMRLCRDALADG